MGSGVFTLDAGLEELEMSPADVQFCSDKLKEVSRSFATVITFLPNSPRAPLRVAVAVFYLVLRALDTVEDDMDLSRFDEYVTEEDKRGVEDARLAAKQRLLRGFSARLSDAMQGAGDKHQHLAGFGEGSERELLDNLQVLVHVMQKLPPRLAAVILDITDEMAQGMADYIARDLKNGTQDDVDFEKYCHVAAGTVGDGLTRLFAVCEFCPADLVKRRDLWDSMGSFLQRTNIIRDYLEDLVDGRAWWPRSVWERYVEKDTQFNQPPSLSMLAEASSISNGMSVECLNHMICDALGLVNNCIEYLDALDEPSVLSFCALPQVMAIATLAACFDNPQVFLGVVKIRKGQAAEIMLDLAPVNGKSAQTIRIAYMSWFVRLVKEIQAKAHPKAALHHQSQRVYHQCTQVLRTLDDKLTVHKSRPVVNRRSSLSE